MYSPYAWHLKVIEKTAWRHCEEPFCGDKAIQEHGLLRRPTVFLAMTPEVSRTYSG